MGTCFKTFFKNRQLYKTLNGARGPEVSNRFEGNSFTPFKAEISTVAAKLKA